MSFYVQVDSDYPDHPKTLKLQMLIGPEADCYPVRLWMWAAKFAKNGVIRGGAPLIEAVVKWTGEKGKLHKALMSAPEGYNVGFIERDGITLHDWMNWTGKDIKTYEAKKEANRNAYQERRNRRMGVKASNPEDVAAAVSKELGADEEGRPL